MRISTCVTLFDDESVRKKLTVMSKWDAAFDDARNETETDFGEQVDAFMQLGHTYRVTIEELLPVHHEVRNENQGD